VANTNLLLNASRSQKETAQKPYKISGQDADEKHFAAVEMYASNPPIKTEVEQHMAIAYSKIDKAVKRGASYNGAKIQLSAETETAPLRRDRRLLQQVSLQQAVVKESIWSKTERWVL